MKGRAWTTSSRIGTIQKRRRSAKAMGSSCVHIGEKWQMYNGYPVWSIWATLTRPLTIWANPTQAQKIFSFPKVMSWWNYLLNWWHEATYKLKLHIIGYFSSSHKIIAWQCMPIYILYSHVTHYLVQYLMHLDCYMTTLWELFQINDILLYNNIAACNQHVKVIH